MNTRHAFLSGMIALTAALALGPAIAGAVDDERLRAAGRDHDNWLTYSHGYHNHRYSALDEIDRDNVGRLVPKWIYQTGVTGTFQTSPLVVDGVMYFSTPYNHVVALDAATGEKLWRYNHQLITEKLCCGPANRGLALGYDRLYMITVDARLIALHRHSGEVAWEATVADPNSGTPEPVEVLLDSDIRKGHDVTGWTGFSGNMAPIVVDGMVIVGVTGAGYGLHLEGSGDNPLAVVGMAGAQYGLRAFLSAYDAASGELKWRWYSTAERSWEGEFVTRTRNGELLDRDIAAEKAKAADYPDSWRRGGGSLWTHPAVDPELGLLFVGTGNPAPQLDAHTRPGDNLYTVSIVALDIHTGKMKWYDQHVPHDVWGYDVGTPPVLFDYKSNGSTIPAVAQASKTGWMYIYNRATGEPLLRSDPFVPQKNLFRRPTHDGIVIWPAAAGGASWSPPSFNPATGWIYLAAMHMPMRYAVHDIAPDQQRQHGPTYTSVEGAPEFERYGVLSAIDPMTGKVHWQAKTPEILIGGLVTTAGGLLFMGEGNGKFTARDIEDGKLLWEFQTGAGVNAPPVVYRAKGRQFVAVASGGHQLFQFPLGGAVIAFGLLE